MKKIFSLLCAVVLLNSTLQAVKNPMIGGQLIDRKTSIAETIAKVPEFSQFFAALQAAGLVDKLEGEGPFTVFAPTNTAFDHLPAGALDRLLLPENKAQLVAILSDHILTERLTLTQIGAAIRKGKGSVGLKTPSGGILNAKMSVDLLMLTDEAGGHSLVQIPDAFQSNGVIHVVDQLLMPKPKP